MLLKNLDLGSKAMLVNGSRGVIIGFETDVESILIELQNDLEKLKEDRGRFARFSFAFLHFSFSFNHCVLALDMMH
jgi:hypothetical protein